MPKLGDLRKLPRPDDGTETGDETARAATASAGANLIFIPLSLIAAAALIVAGYSAVRWAIIDAERTTESHMAEVEQTYRAADPAVLIREFEDMEKYSLDLIGRYDYQKAADEKAGWGRNALIAGVIAILSGFAGVWATLRGRES